LINTKPELAFCVVESLSVFVQYNNKMNGNRQKTKTNKLLDPLRHTESTHAQGWLIEGGDEDLDSEPVVGLTRKLIEESCAEEDVTRLRRSARLAQVRDVDEDEFHSEGEAEPINEEEIDFESDPEDVLPIID